MNVARIIGFAAVATAVCIGCSDNSRPQKSGKPGTGNSSLLADLRDDSPIIRIGTNVFTKAAFLDLCAIKTRVVEMANKQQLMQSDRKVNPAVVELQTLVAYPGKVSVETAIGEYAATNGISPTTEELGEAKRSFQDACQAGFSSWKKFLSGFPGKMRSGIEAEVKNIATLTAVKRTFLEKQNISISDDEAEKCQRWALDCNARAALTNSLVWATASNVWHQILEGKTTLEDAANKYTQDANNPENGEWAAFTLDGFSDEPKLAKLIVSMKVGEITPPVEGDNGLMILKLSAIEKPENAGAPVRYVLSRIFFRLPEFYDILPMDELKTEMLATKKKKAFEDFVNSLVKSMDVKIVCGKKIEEAREALRMPTTSVF